MNHDMTHEDASRHLDDLVDGGLDRKLAAAVEHHVQACARCTTEVAAIRGLLQRARALPESIEPNRSLWRDIEASIRDVEQSVHAAAPPPRPAEGAAASRWVGWLQPPVWRWATALGAAAVVVAVTVGVWQTWRTEHVPTAIGAREARNVDIGTGAGTHAETAVRGTAGDVVSALELECMGAGKSLVAAMDGWSGDANAELAASITAGLDAVNLAIAETRAALGADPQDAELLRLLTARYEQKLALLHGAMRLIEEA